MTNTARSFLSANFRGKFLLDFPEKSVLIPSLRLQGQNSELRSAYYYIVVCFWAKRKFQSRFKFLPILLFWLELGFSLPNWGVFIDSRRSIVFPRTVADFKAFLQFDLLRFFVEGL